MTVIFAKMSDVWAGFSTPKCCHQFPLAPWPLHACPANVPFLPADPSVMLHSKPHASTDYQDEIDLYNTKTYDTLRGTPKNFAIDLSLLNGTAPTNESDTNDSSSLSDVGQGFPSSQTLEETIIAMGGKVNLPARRRRKKPSPPHVRFQNFNTLSVIETESDDFNSPIITQAVNLSSRKSLLEYSTSNDSKSTSEFWYMDKFMSFELHHDIVGIDSKCINNTIYSLCRSSQSHQLYRLNETNIALCNHIKPNKHMYTSACLSKFDEKVLTCDEFMNVKLIDCKINKTSYASKLLGKKQTKAWSSAYFTSCSSKGVACDKFNIFELDFNQSRSCSVMYDICSFGKSFNVDEICGLEVLDNRNYLLACMSEKVVLFDNRNKKIPVLTWNHMLSLKPTRSVMRKYGESDLLILSNNLEKKVSMIVVDVSSNSASSPSLVRHCDLFHPMQVAACQENLWLDLEVSNRLDIDITGLSTLKNPNCKSKVNFNVLVSNSCGDVFSQQLVPTESVESQFSKHKDEVTYVERLREWEDECIEIAVKKLEEKPQVNVVDISVGLLQRLKKHKRKSTNLDSQLKRSKVCIMY